MHKSQMSNVIVLKNTATKRKSSSAPKAIELKIHPEAKPQKNKQKPAEASYIQNPFLNMMRSLADNIEQDYETIILNTER